jgi:hypothetical protein
MWVQHTSNYICNYLDQYQIQKKHIERVLSAREHINNTKPYYPKFLQLRLGKNQMEEEKNNVIKEVNKNLYYKIESAGIKPSKYSMIYKPKECPPFNKEIIKFKRVKEQLKNYQENIRFYDKIERVKSFYDKEEIIKRNNVIKENIKKLQKSLLELQPSLLFLSPQTVKKGLKKIKYTNFNKSKTKRCNSCTNIFESKNYINRIQNLSNLSRTNRQKRKRYDKILNINTNQFSLDKVIKINDNIKKIIKNPIKNKDNKIRNKSHKERNRNKKIEDNFNCIKKVNYSYNNNTNDIKDKNQIKTKKRGLKRNASEFNIFE